MQEDIGGLLAQLDLEQLEVNLFRGQSRGMGNYSVFGGQVLGQALMAASRTVDPERVVHSMHAYFLRPGDIKAPIVYDVDRIRDGRSFTTRRVVAIQHGRAIFNMAASFQAPEPSLEHQSQMPQGIPDPEDLITEQEYRQQFKHLIPEVLREQFVAPRPVEVRPVEHVNPVNPEPRDPQRAFWFKASGAMPDDTLMHQAVLAWASDMALMGTAMLPHGYGFWQDNFQGASLDHAMWFHREFRADEWLLYSMDSDTSQGARGLSRGQIFSRDGRLIATTMQEGLMRLHED